MAIERICTVCLGVSMCRFLLTVCWCFILAQNRRFLILYKSSLVSLEEALCEITFSWQQRAADVLANDSIAGSWWWLEPRWESSCWHEQGSAQESACCVTPGKCFLFTTVMARLCLYCDRVMLVVRVLWLEVPLNVQTQPNQTPNTHSAARKQDELFLAVSPNILECFNKTLPVWIVFV